LMSALPYQSTEKFVTSLKRVIALKPEHISAYSLIIEKGTPFYEKYKFEAVLREAGKPTEHLPSEETEYEIYKKTQEILAEAGYEHYEVSNYAKQGKEARHNIGYWKRVPYLGVGLGAASLIGEVRYSNIREIEAYIKACGNISAKEIDGVPALNLHESADAISRHAQMEEFMFLGLRMLKGVTRTEFKETFGVEIEAVYGEVLNQLQEEDLIEKKAGVIKLSDHGMDISNYVLAQFLLD
jgi:oxygen-independent coproporphyrinogen-3 oxidase